MKSSKSCVAKVPRQRRERSRRPCVREWRNCAKCASGDTRSAKGKNSPAREALPLRSSTQKAFRSEEHTSELQSLMRISYAVFCLKKKKTEHVHQRNHYEQTINSIPIYMIRTQHTPHDPSVQ